MSFTMRLGSGLCSGGMPFGVNWTTSLDGWYDALGFWGFSVPVLLWLLFLGWWQVWVSGFGEF